MEEIPCTVHPVKLLYLEGERCTGCGVLEVTFQTASGVQINEISFTNFYVASIAIRGETVQRKGKYRTIVKNFKLMASPHFANEAQKTFTIKTKDYCCDKELFTSLQFILRQPSPRWHNFNLDQIKIVRLIREEKSFGENTNADDVTSRSMNQHATFVANFHQHLGGIEELLKHCNVMQESNEPKSFEADGCYDMNLLSYGT